VIAGFAVAGALQGFARGEQVGYFLATSPTVEAGLVPFLLAMVLHTPDDAHAFDNTSVSGTITCSSTVSSIRRSRRDSSVFSLVTNSFTADLHGNRSESGTCTLQ
jgi:hypothetical protein